ncbi:hypothetical protein BDI4_360084 [Burkholderia diffusa]|nr:hypothetical protein BDI4_360084 [Burkholderia diffusa]
MRASGRRHCSVPAGALPDAASVSESPEFIPTELRQVSIPRSHILSNSDEQACRIGPTLRPQFLDTARGRLGFIQTSYV